MATMLPIPSSPFSTSTPLLLTATLCLSAAALRIMGKINTLAASLIAFGAIAQYFIHRVNAKSALISFAAQFKYQVEDLAIKKNSLDTAFEEQQQRFSDQKSLTQSMLESNQAHEKEINRLHELIAQLEEERVGLALAASMTKDSSLTNSWAMVESNAQTVNEFVNEEIKIVKKEIEILKKEDIKDQLKGNRELEGALRQELQLLKTKGMLEHIRQMRLLLHEFLPEMREAFQRAALHKHFCNKFQAAVKQERALTCDDLEKLSQLSWEDYLGDGIENIVHIEANLMGIFSKIHEIVSLKTNTMRQM
ncbi:MAG: hypothetical protein H7A40_02255 [Chlamydiales bacterium]|nr:hypothetical protein [Chlamydiales bacterium]